MQCPNCRKVETGNWLYANGSRSSQNVNFDDWGPDEDLYDVGHSEMATFVPLRVQWCPIGRLAQIPSLFDDIEPSPQATFHDFMGQNFNTEPVSVSTAHPGPYLAYFQPLPPPASSSSSDLTERTMDSAGYHDHWNPLSGPTDGRPLQTVHPIDFHHNPWAHMPHSYSQSNNNNGLAEQPGVPVGAMRVGGVDSDNQQRWSLPSFYGNRFGSRPRIPSVPPMAPQFIRAHGNINEPFQQSSSSLFAGSQRSGGMRPLGPGGPAVPPPENIPFSLFPPASSGPSSVETEDTGGNQFYAWERDHFAPYPLMPVNNEGTWWSSSQQQQQQPPPTHGTPEPPSASRRLFGQWISAGRSPPPENRSPDNTSFRQMHIPRM
uniref:RING/U-box superfamily protein n=2 Tax=Arundo donax TaxID=35708 RepID=A0A0A8XTV2_ARUDO